MDKKSFPCAVSSRDLLTLEEYVYADGADSASPAVRVSVVGPSSVLSTPAVLDAIQWLENHVRKVDPDALKGRHPSPFEELRAAQEELAAAREEAGRARAERDTAEAAASWSEAAKAADAIEIRQVTVERDAAEAARKEFADALEKSRHELAQMVLNAGSDAAMIAAMRAERDDAVKELQGLASALGVAKAERLELESVAIALGIGNNQTRYEGQLASRVRELVTTRSEAQAEAMLLQSELDDIKGGGSIAFLASRGFEIVVKPSQS